MGKKTGKKKGSEFDDLGALLEGKGGGDGGGWQTGPVSAAMDEDMDIATAAALAAGKSKKAPKADGERAACAEGLLGGCAGMRSCSSACHAPCSHAFA